MVQKIKKSLGILNNIDFNVWFDDLTGCGHVDLHHHCVTSVIIELITKVAKLVAITCVDSDTYRITIMTK